MNRVMLDEEGFTTRPCFNPDLVGEECCEYLRYDNLFYEPYCNNTCVCQYLPHRWASDSAESHRTNGND